MLTVVLAGCGRGNECEIQTRTLGAITISNLEEDHYHQGPLGYASIHLVCGALGCKAEVTESGIDNGAPFTEETEQSCR